MRKQKLLIVLIALAAVVIITQHIANNTASIMQDASDGAKPATSRFRVDAFALREMEDYLTQRSVTVTEANCRKLFSFDLSELHRVKRSRNKSPLLTSDREVLEAASTCSQFVTEHGFITRPLTELEANFSIAFSILVYTQASQVVRLLRMVYRPQNYYCLHVDGKSPQALHQAIRAVASCLPNVFVASRAVRVVWGRYSVLEPELVCLHDLQRYSGWRYFINLTGQEFPLRTNYDIVRALMALNGTNDVVSEIPRGAVKYRWEPFLPAPHGLRLYKGAAHVALSRPFVHFVLHADVARHFRQWCKQTWHPDEHFFNTLNVNWISKETRKVNDTALSLQPRTQYVTRFKNWVPRYPCPGHRVVRGICILSALELPVLSGRRELFANKFHEGYSHLALRCLQERLHRRVRQQTRAAMVASR